MTEKLTGYLLIVVGIVLIIFSAFSVYSVFSSKVKPAELFQFKGVSVPLSALVGGEIPNSKALPEIEILPAEVLNSTSNTLAHLLLMGFLSSIGSKIAFLGVNLVRPIVIKLKDQTLEAEKTGK